MYKQIGGSGFNKWGELNSEKYCILILPDFCKIGGPLQSATGEETLKKRTFAALLKFKLQIKSNSTLCLLGKMEGSGVQRILIRIFLLITFSLFYLKTNITHANNLL